jgi:hypothetical protein
MGAEALLRGLRSRGVEMMLEGDRLRFQGPPGAFTEGDRRAVSALREEIMSYLSLPLPEQTQQTHHTEQTVQTMQTVGGPALARVLADLATARERFAGHAARLAVLDVIEQTFRRHHDQGDPLLIEDAPLVSELAARWAQEDADRAIRHGGWGVTP